MSPSGRGERRGEEQNFQMSSNPTPPFHFILDSSLTGVILYDQQFINLQTAPFTIYYLIDESFIL